jgi:protocatechuate 3,4-dioxygenase beta subunit
MDNDDRPVGRILSRREVLGLFGLASAAALAACARGQQAMPTATTNAEAATAEAVAANPTAVEATQAEAASVAATSGTVPACVVRPEMTEGPYFLDIQLDRSDIRVEPSTGAAVAGVPLELVFNVTQVNGGACAALPGAMVDLWHCDAAGVYSGVERSSGTKFLRGFQTTDANGLARFTTIYPGWYPGRTVHIHYKVRSTGADGNEYEFTSQLFFDEATSAEVYAREPYSAKGPQDTSNARDGIFLDEGLLSLTPAGDGYATRFDIALDLSDTQAGAGDSAGAVFRGGPPQTP